MDTFMIIVVLLLLLALFFRTLYRIHADKAPIVEYYTPGMRPKAGERIRFKGNIFEAALNPDAGLTNTCDLCAIKYSYCEDLCCIHVKGLYYKKV